MADNAPSVESEELFPSSPPVFSSSPAGYPGFQQLSATSDGPNLLSSPSTRPGPPRNTSPILLSTGIRVRKQGTTTNCSFSSKLLLSDRRNRLGDDVIEACECLKAWQREGFLLSQDVEDMERMLGDLEDQGMSLEKTKR